MHLSTTVSPFSIPRCSACSFIRNLVVYLILLSCWVFLPLHAQGAEPGVRNMTPKERVSELTGRLGLTEDQQAQLLPVIEAQMEKREALAEKYRGRGFGNRRALRSEIRQLRQEYERRLSGILTEEQMAQRRAYLEKHGSFDLLFSHR